MRPVVVLNPVGCFLGNTTMQYLFAYAHAERVGAEFQCRPWIGEKVFSLPPYTRPHEFRSGPRLQYPVRSEIDLKPDDVNVEIRGYAQSQAAMIYSAEQARTWLRLARTTKEVFDTPELEAVFTSDHVVAHMRRGDFQGYGYPLVSEKSYHVCVARNRLCWPRTDALRFTTEENATVNPSLEDEIRFLPDFYRLVHAPVMLRANSSFSWLAGLLNRGRVFSPIVSGLTGGQEHDCEFVEGNYPALSDRAGATDLRMIA